MNVDCGLNLLPPLKTKHSCGSGQSSESNCCCVASYQLAQLWLKLVPSKYKIFHFQKTTWTWHDCNSKSKSLQLFGVWFSSTTALKNWVNSTFTASLSGLWALSLCPPRVQHFQQHFKWHAGCDFRGVGAGGLIPCSQVLNSVSWMQLYWWVEGREIRDILAGISLQFLVIFYLHLPLHLTTNTRKPLKIRWT